MLIYKNMVSSSIFFIGLFNFPKNWHEQFFIIDFTYLQELIPDAKNVSNELDLKYIFKGAFSAKGFYRKLNAVLIFIFWYPSILLWRWSLKATLWLWWPLALLLRPPFEGKNLEAVRDIAAIRVTVSKWLGFAALLGLLLLIASYVPSFQTWVDTLGDSVSKPFAKLAELQLPPPGLRQWALWLCCGLAGLEWLMLLALQAQHKKLLEEEDSIYGNIPEARLQTFLHRARRVQRLHTALIVSVILLGYSVVLHLANHYYPAELAQFIPTWLMAWL